MNYEHLGLFTYEEVVMILIGNYISSASDITYNFQQFEVSNIEERTERYPTCNHHLR